MLRTLLPVIAICLGTLLMVHEWTLLVPAGLITTERALGIASLMGIGGFWLGLGAGFLIGLREARK